MIARSIIFLTALLSILTNVAGGKPEDIQCESRILCPKTRCRFYILQLALRYVIKNT